MSPCAPPLKARIQAATAPALHAATLFGQPLPSCKRWKSDALGLRGKMQSTKRNRRSDGCAIYSRLRYGRPRCKRHGTCIGAESTTRFLVCRTVNYRNQKVSITIQNSAFRSRQSHTANLRTNAVSPPSWNPWSGRRPGSAPTSPNWTPSSPPSSTAPSAGNFEWWFERNNELEMKRIFCRIFELKGCA